MITITEAKAKKAVGSTSLFLNFNYNQDILEAIHKCSGYIYDKKSKVWELPLNQLSKFIDNACTIDDIKLNLLNDSTDKTLDLVCKHEIQPFDYQRDGIKWMINNTNALLLDEMGLGKSLQLIYTAEELHEQKGIEHCLVICGVNSLKENWKKEINKFSKLSCRILGQKVSKSGKVHYCSTTEKAEELYNKIDEFFIITNIETLRSDEIVEAITKGKNNFDMIVVDEIHRAKSSKSEQGNGLLKLSKIGKYHYGLTGTLLTNSPLDAYVPLKFIGVEHSTLTNFKNFYCNIGMQFGHYVIYGYKNINVLQEEIDNVSLRRTKSILNLPEKTIIPEYIELTDKHLNFYNNISAGVVEEADRVNIKTTSLLGLVVRLRQASSCPSVLSTSNIVNNKLERACELTEDILSNNESVVIFSQFKEPLYDLNNMLKNYNPMLCTGDQDDSTISNNIDEFQNSKGKIILATVSKLGTGVTLTNASYAIFIDTPWTYSDFSQACDRVHRVGSKKPVYIYNLIAKDTIDERVWKLVNNKRDISDYVVDHKDTNKEELLELLGIKKDGSLFD